MSSSESQYSIVIHAKKDEKSKFSRMKSFLRQKVANMMYAIREKASKIYINGRRIVAQPDDIPTELKYISVKQLSKIKKTLAVLSEDANGPGLKESEFFWRPGICAPAPSPRNGSNDDDDDGSDIIVRYENAKEPMKASPKGKVNTSTSSLNVEHVQEEESNPEIEAVEEEVEKRHSPIANQEVPTETKRLMRKNRPQAAKGERSSTVIPSYIIIDEDSSVPINPRRRKRPTAAKGKRTVSSSVDLFDLPVDVLLERFRDPSTDARPKRNRPQAPRGRASRGLEAEATTELMPCVENNEMVDGGKADDDATALENKGGRVRVIQVAEVPGAGIGEESGNVPENPPEEDTTSLDDLLEDLGIHTTWNTKARGAVSRNKDARVDAWMTSDDDDDNDGDLFGVPYLPKSQRTGNGLQRRF